MQDRSPDRSHHRKLAEWTIVTGVGVVLGVAGIATSGYYQLALWLGWGAATLTTIAWALYDSNHIRQKKTVAGFFGLLLLVAALLLQFELVPRLSRAASPSPTVTDQKPGDSKTEGDFSPAVSGSHNTINFGAPASQPAKGKKR